jgi:hypothetical protein
MSIPRSNDMKLGSCSCGAQRLGFCCMNRLPSFVSKVFVQQTNSVEIKIKFEAQSSY